MNFVFISLLFFITSEATLKLIFNDEFNESDAIDEKKWKILDEKDICGGNAVKKLNCHTNNKTNIMIINGTLVLAAIRQKHLNRFITAPEIQTEQSFSGGRFEIRAALPRGKMIRSSIYFLPITKSGKWARDGDIDFMANNQKQEYKYGITFLRNGLNNFKGGEQTVSENLHEFQVYVLEWTETEMKFIFNDRILSKINLTKELEYNYNPFRKKFTLTINLWIGDHSEGHIYFPGQTLYENDIREWECSLLMIDYIRVYQNISGKVEKLANPEPNNTKASDICSQVMPLIRPSKPKWKLIFADEFTGNNIDHNIWKIKHDQDYFSGYNTKQLNYNTNSSKNIRLTDGTLVLAAIRENYLTKGFTAPLISSNRGFKYGRFEIRAALPVGKLLRPHIFLEPIEEMYRNSTIDILKNTQFEEFYYGYHLDETVLSKSFNSKGLRYFHNYVIEWTETELMWSFDNKTIDRISFQETGNKLLDIPKRLVISLGVGGTKSPNEILTSTESDKWICSLFLLDYIRVYGNENEIPNNYEQNNITSSKICTKIMPTLRKGMKKEAHSLNLIQIISISGFLLFLLTLGFTIFLFKRMKRYRDIYSLMARNDNKEELDIYNEAFESDYTNPYETINFEENQSAINEEQVYLAITNKYKVSENHDYLVMNGEPKVDSI